MKLSLCIAGLGFWGQYVADEVRHLADEVEVSFASRDLAKAGEYCQRFGGAKAFGSYEEAAADPSIEALYFLTPHHLHLQHAMLAARHGKHVLMEKPIARTLDEGRRIVEAAAEAGVKLMIAENFRFLPTVTKCKELLDQGAIGDLRVVQVQEEMYSKPWTWRMKLELAGGGTLIDGGIHAVDAMLNLGGFPKRVYAAVPPQVHDDIEGEDRVVLTMELPGGAVGLLNYSIGAPLSQRRQFTSVSGTKGQIRFEPFGAEVTVDTLDGEESIQLGEGSRGTQPMLREFVSCIREDREPVMSGEQGLRDLAVVLAAYRSAREGAAVALSPP